MEEKTSTIGEERLNSHCPICNMRIEGNPSAKRMIKNLCSTRLTRWFSSLHLGWLWSLYPTNGAQELHAELKEKLARMYEVKDPNTIFVFKFMTHFRGGKSTGFGLIYDSVENTKKFSPNTGLSRSLNSNSFTGTIPPSIGNLSRLSWLDLSQNKLMGLLGIPFVLQQEQHKSFVQLRSKTIALYQ